MAFMVSSKKAKFVVGGFSLEPVVGSAKEILKSAFCSEIQHKSSGTICFHVEVFGVLLYHVVVVGYSSKQSMIIAV